MIAILVGGADTPQWNGMPHGAFQDYEYAKALCPCATVFIANDMIEAFPYEAQHLVTLHPTKLRRWLQNRVDRAFPIPEDADIWAHYKYYLLTKYTEDA